MKFTAHDYNLERVHQRLQDLLTVLQYDSEERPFLKDWERIFINQQRGDLLVFKRYLLNEAKPHEVRYYLLPGALETKVENIIDLIKNKNWKSNFEDN